MMGPEDSGEFFAPALLTGTSEEFLGRKPLPRVLRARNTVFVLGPQGVGKSTVARSLAGPAHIQYDTRQLEHVLIDCVRLGRWSERIEAAPSLVIDGPVWLRHRPGAVMLLLDLARRRSAAGRRTVFCQVSNPQPLPGGESDGSIEELIAQSEPGSAVVVGLRFPTGRKSRLRCARQLCEELGLPAVAAHGSESLEPWRYDRLVAFLVERAWRPTDGPEGGTRE